MPLLKWTEQTHGYWTGRTTLHQVVAEVSPRRIGEPARWVVGDASGTANTAGAAKRFAELAYVGQAARKT